jgi:hypothetical protein
MFGPSANDKRRILIPGSNGRHQIIGGRNVKRLTLVLIAIFVALVAKPLWAENRFIVRVPNGWAAVQFQNPFGRIASRIEGS